MYTEELGDVHAYVNTTMAFFNYIEPPSTAPKSIIYRQLFDDLKSPCISITHFNKPSIRLLTCLIFLPYHFYKIEHIRANHWQPSYTINIATQCFAKVCWFTAC